MLKKRRLRAGKGEEDGEDGGGGGVILNRRLTNSP